MTAKGCTGFFLGIDRDRPLMAVLGFLLILVPVLHPVAEAAAAERAYAGIICSAFGPSPSLDRQSGVPPAQGDCPCCVACHMHCGVAVPLPRAVGLPPLAKARDTVARREHTLPPRPEVSEYRPPGRGPPLSL